MPLVRNHPEPGATKFLIQTQHHRTAIGSAIGYVDAGYAQLPTNDSLPSEFVAIEHDWVIETIYQGAYMREYHLWEKFCKEFFSPMGIDTKPPRGVPFPDHVKQIIFAHFGLVLPEDVVSALSEMRGKVNIMKHESGLEADQFVRADDYAIAVAAIERFWEFLVDNEELRLGNHSPMKVRHAAAPPALDGQIASRRAPLR